MNHPNVIVKAALILIAVPLLLYQARKPTKWIGRWFIRGMNLAHSALTDWGLGHVQIGKSFTILDVGCGGGRAVAKLAALAPEGKVYGVDYSAESVEIARRENVEAIAAGRVEIEQASVSRLPFPDEHFDLVTAVETQYYWPHPVEDMREVRRVVKPGGRVLVILETYKGGRYGAVKGIVMKALMSKHLALEQHRGIFVAAGFSEIEISTETRHGWFCGVGTKRA